MAAKKERFDEVRGVLVHAHPASRPINHYPISHQTLRVYAHCGVSGEAAAPNTSCRGPWHPGNTSASSQKQLQSARTMHRRANGEDRYQHPAFAAAWKLPWSVQCGGPTPIDNYRATGINAIVVYSILPYNSRERAPPAQSWSWR